MVKILNLIDGDSLIYQSSKETLEESLVIIDEKIQNIFEKTEATHYVIFISFSPYFRHKIDSNYKSNRNKYDSPLKWRKCLKSYLIEKWGAQWMDQIESDDLVNYWNNQDLIYGYKYANSEEKAITWKNSTYNQELEEVTKIICSPDKDILQSTPGKHFNYSYKIKEESKSKSKDKLTDSDFNKGWWVETSIEDAYTNFWKSMVCGDNSDGIKGIEGKGPVYFNTIFKEINNYDDGTIIEFLRERIYKSYLDIYGTSQGIFEFQKNYRLLHLLENDEDFMREVNKLPEFPKIYEVPKKIVIDQIIEV